MNRCLSDVRHSSASPTACYTTQCATQVHPQSTNTPLTNSASIPLVRMQTKFKVKYEPCHRMPTPHVAVH